MSYNFPEEEKKILQFWKENKIFDKLREKNSKSKKHWSFLDGPITANNPMGVHHAWGRTYKDLLQRYFAMKGYEERYQNGFDCQGLWVEVEVEKELGFKTKKDIESYGIDKFVNLCKKRVLKYSGIQTQQSIRLGQWMDWENSYYTMSEENNYAIWHFLKKCWELGYLYKGRDSVPWCPRCGTAISQHEILTEEYKEITHDSVYFKLHLEGKQGEFLLVWTTTPWTLLANIAVAIDDKLDYSLVEQGKEKYWLAKELVEKVFKENFKVVKTVKGEKLVGLKYSFAFDDLPGVKEVALQSVQGKQDLFHTVIATNDQIMPISVEDGTGMVHVAVSAGEEDFKLGKKLGLPVIEVIDESAVYLEGLGEFSGKNAKTDPKIILDYLVSNGNWIFKIEKYKHRYPTCWRCKTELVWRVVDEWYISMEKLREPLKKIVKKINWIPEFGKDRELDWLNNMHDWLISKKRYWGLALPIFECQGCGTFEVIGSKEELKKRAVEGWDKFNGNTPHRPWVDNIKIKCKKCKTTISRIKDVGNPWLDAGIVPFSTMKYFSDKYYWKKWFPAEIVIESFPGQFKNWFYSLLVMSAVLEDRAPMKTIFGYALVKDEKGEEMHKSKGNAIWFDDAVEKVGADAIRWFYMMQNPAENANFGYKNIGEVQRKVLILYNVYSFFNTYVKKGEFGESNSIQIEKLNNVLDRWIFSKINHLINIVEFNLNNYNISKAVSLIEDFFINNLSLWYIRRSRKRFHELSEAEILDDRKIAIHILYYVLLNTAKIISPIMPFFTEKVYQDIKVDGMPESIHLFDWPKVKENQTDLELEQKMDQVRNIVTLALAKRSAKSIKVRQPLATLKINSQKYKVLEDEFLNVIKDEINVKEVLFDSEINEDVELDLNITEELKEEGKKREIIRFGNDLRREGGLTPAMYIDNIISTTTIVSAPEVMEALKVKDHKFIKISSEKEIPNDYVVKEVEIEKGKKDIIAIPKNK